MTQAPGRVETPLSRTKPSSRFRCVAATARVAAAKTTGTSSRGTTQSVRRIASMPHEAPVLVERALDVGRRDAVAARPDREEDRDRVGRVQADERAGDRERIGRARRGVEPVAHDEARAPLGDVDPLHPTLLPT